MIRLAVPMTLLHRWGCSSAWTASPRPCCWNRTNATRTLVHCGAAWPRRAVTAASTWWSPTPRRRSRSLSCGSPSRCCPGGGRRTWEPWCSAPHGTVDGGLHQRAQGRVPDPPGRPSPRGRRQARWGQMPAGQPQRGPGERRPRQPGELVDEHRPETGRLGHHGVEGLPAVGTEDVAHLARGGAAEDLPEAAGHRRGPFTAPQGREPRLGVGVVEVRAVPFVRSELPS